MCSKSFKSQADLNFHAQREHRPDLLNCTKCSKQFTAKNALSQHMNSQHSKNPPVGHSQWAQQKNNSHDYSCTHCNNGFESLNELKEHKKSEHNDQNHNGLLTLNIPCRFYKQGRCNKQPCKFSHEKQHQQNSSEWVPKCTRGQQCQFFVWGTCNFFHQGVGVQQRRKQQNTQFQNRQQDVQQNRQHEEQRKCHFQDRCWNQNCKFSHVDFRIGKRLSGKLLEIPKYGSKIQNTKKVVQRGKSNRKSKRLNIFSTNAASLKSKLKKF